MEVQLYTYKATIPRVVDGDTVEANVDLGFGITVKQRLRLLGVNTPEIVGEYRDKGLEAKEWLATVVEGQEVVVQTVKDKKDKYGRYLAVIWLDGESINDDLIQMGYGI